jgi:hypothetical protein
MTPFIITESPVARKLVERLVSCHPALHGRQMEFRDTEGRHGTLSKAQTILLVRHEPVVMVADADKGYENGEDDEDYEDYDQRALVERVLSRIAGTYWWRFILFDPSMEVVLFQDEALRRALLPMGPTEKQLRRARRRPKRVLAELFSQAGEQDWSQALMQRLEQVDLSVLWATKKLKRLESFLLKRTQAEPVTPATTGQEDAPAE